MLVPSSAAADRAAVARSGFPAFVELANRQEFGRDYVHAPYARMLAEHVEALYHGEILTLLVSMPPGSMKSRTCSALAPAWIWTLDRKYTFMRAGYDSQNAAKLASDTRLLCQSRWYIERWGEFVFDRLPHRPSGEGEYWTLSGGFSLCSSIQAGRFVGRHAKMMIADDPVKGQNVAAADPKALQNTRTWYTTVAKTRGQMGHEQRMMVVAQRLHENDLNGLLIETYKDDPKFAHVMLPWHFEPERACETRIGRDWRIGMPAGTELFNNPTQRHTVKGLLLGGVDNPVYQAQYQQNPTAAASDYFPADTFLDMSGMPPFELCPATAITVDPSFTPAVQSDYCAIDVWGFWRGHFICYYSEWVKRGAFDQADAVKRVRELYPTVTHVLVEGSANGHFVLEALARDGVPGCVKVQADDTKWTGTNDRSKKGRAMAASYYFKSKRVHFDHDAPWFRNKRMHMTRFPGGAHDDMVDTAVMGVLWLNHRYGGGVQFERAMAAIEKDSEAVSADALASFANRASRGHVGSPDAPKPLTFAERAALARAQQEAEARNTGGPVLGLAPDALF